ncbi:MAG: orotidine-5'-phosphate decarboxylase [Ginsengibacter sp.]
MNRKYLIQQIKEKQSYLCIGLDTDIEKIPGHLRSHPDAVFEFNKQIIDATMDVCVAYKMNTAFYEAQGGKGWEALEKTVAYIPPTHFKIADAKRGDIGNTSHQYAKAFFETIPFDAITVAPYMGSDSILPFLEYGDKWAIVLGLTSNSGAHDFELQQLVPEDISIITDETSSYNSYEKFAGTYLYEKVIFEVSRWGNIDNLMFVVGATKAADLLSIRKIIPDHFLLIPGVGFQGGSLADVSKYGLNADCGLLVNASRAIIYAGNKKNFAEEARAVALRYQKEMKSYL